MGATDLRISELDRADLDELEPLWNALREHHLSVTPEWLPKPFARESSWARRRAMYGRWLGDSDGFGLVARREGKAVGYALCHLRPGSPTWQAGERAGEIETLSLLPEERRRGTGPLLLEAVCEELRRCGATEVSLHVLEGNAEAERFYAREGFKPLARWLVRPLPPR